MAAAAAVITHVCGGGRGRTSTFSPQRDAGVETASARASQALERGVSPDVARLRKEENDAGEIGQL